MLGTDIITIFKKQSDGTFSRHIVRGVQWTDKDEVVDMNGRINVVKYASITFFEGTFEDLNLTNFTEEDAIFYGAIDTEVTGEKGNRISDLLNAYPKSGLIKSVNDNSNRSFLRNIKVVLV